MSLSLRILNYIISLFLKLIHNMCYYGILSLFSAIYRSFMAHIFPLDCPVVNHRLFSRTELRSHLYHLQIYHRLLLVWSVCAVWIRTWQFNLFKSAKIFENGFEPVFERVVIMLLLLLRRGNQVLDLRFRLCRCKLCEIRRSQRRLLCQMAVGHTPCFGFKISFLFGATIVSLTEKILISIAMNC